MEPMVYVLGGAGVALALAAAVMTLMQRINVAAFMSMLRKLISAGNVDRARKLCAAASGTPFGRTAAAILDAAAKAPADMGAGLAADSMREALARSSEVERRRIRRFGWLALLGAAVAAGGMLLATSVGHAGPWFFGPAPAAAGLMLWTWSAVLRTGKETAHHGPLLIEAMAAARPPG